MLVLSVFWVLPGLAQEPRGAGALSPMRPAFGAGDIDWQNTAEFPANPNVKGFAGSREDQILRCIGVRHPGASHGSWTAGQPKEEEKAKPKYCRLALKKTVRIGTIVQGSWGDHRRPFARARIAILKPDAPFPGDVYNNEHWEELKAVIPIRGASVFVLPVNAGTRAVRLTSPISATRFFAGRLVDLGANALVFVSAGSDQKLLRGQNWEARLKQPIGPEAPQWLMYTWEQPESVRGVVLYQPMFSSYEVQVYTGEVDVDLLTAPPRAWQRIAHRQVQPPWRWAFSHVVDFGKEIRTCAVRIRISRPFVRENSDITHWFGGKGQVCTQASLVVLKDLRDGEVKRPTAKPLAELHPPIPIRFKLEHPGYVTLVLEDLQGKRVKNLVSDTLFPAGDNVFWWDGMDESNWKNVHIHMVAMYYEIRGNLVRPGAYKVRGLWRKPISLRYEFPVYSGGNRPAWPTASRKGAWLADHTPPSAALALPGKKPQMLLSCFVAEAGEGLVWTDLSGKRVYGLRGIGGGGGWWGADYLARDDGDKAISGIYAYNGGCWKDYLELWAMGPNRKLFTHKFNDAKKAGMGGLAVRNGILFASLPKMDQLLIVDGKSGKQVTMLPLKNPRGLYFDSQGRLLALSEKKLLRFSLAAVTKDLKLPEPELLVATGLEDPQGLTIDDDGNIYVSDWGKSNQVKVYQPDGTFIRAIGKGGEQKVGPYDETQMLRPKGIAISADNHLWIAENHDNPKRVSIWKLAGSFVKAMYGPHWYGGGGNLDPLDKTRFYIARSGGMEFKLDWEKGANKLAHIYYIPGKTGATMPGGGAWHAAPQVPVYINGRQYMSNCYVAGPTNGEGAVSIWLMRDGAAVPVASLGNTSSWTELHAEKFKDRRPQGINLGNATYLWCDLNGDGQVQPNEVSFKNQPVGSVCLQRDLSITTSLAAHYQVLRYTDKGVPVYDLAQGKTLVPGARVANTSGGGQVIAGRDGWTVTTFPLAPYPNGSMLTGALNGRPMWGYPCEFLGLHNSMSSPIPQSPGHVIGTTRLLGPTVTPKGTEEEVWAINGNMGVIYLFTTDGLHVGTLFKDCRVAPGWPEKGQRNMLLNHLSLRQECFFPTINQLDDGSIYLVVGQPTSNLVRVEGLDSIRRLPAWELQVSAEQLKQAADHFTGLEAQRLSKSGVQTLTVSIREQAPIVDGKLDEWPAAYFVSLDKDTQAAVAVTADRLYAAYKTHDGNLLNNAGGIWQQLFKTGGALDLMLGVNPDAEPKRQEPVAGDLRLLVTKVKGIPKAVLYRAVVPGGKEPVSFRSWHVLTLDSVEDLSAALKVAQQGGNYEFSFPLAKLGLSPAKGMVIRGDIGVLRAAGAKTIRRLYWHNKATGIVSDVPSEAKLTPGLWGRWRFLGAYPRPKGKVLYDTTTTPTPAELKPNLVHIVQWVRRRYPKPKLLSRLGARQQQGRCVVYLQMTDEFQHKSLDFRKDFARTIFGMWARQCVRRNKLYSKRYAHVVLVDKNRKIVGGFNPETGVLRWLGK